MAGVCRAVAWVPSFFPLHELGYSEELVTLNFRALGQDIALSCCASVAAIRRVGAALKCFVAIDRYGPERIPSGHSGRF